MSHVAAVRPPGTVTRTLSAIRTPQKRVSGAFCSQATIAPSTLSFTDDALHKSTQ